ncbi:Mpo1-like protein [Xylophilus sp. GW821-FHT01B05]
MKTLTDQLTQYAAYHRDRRNVATHFAGIPMIVVAVAILLARPRLELLGVTVSPATLAVLLSAIYYLRLDLRLGAAMAVLLAAALVLAQTLAGASTTVWLASGIGLFVVGWVLQFIGHWFEGRKPAFVDDIMGLIIGPLFVAAEAGFAFGWRLELQQAIEARLPPTPSAMQHTQRSAHS